MIAAWSVVSEVDVSPLVEWLAAGKAKWPPVKGGQPNRVHAPPEAKVIIQAVLARFDVPVRYERHYACLSRLMPGRGYGFHQDPQPPEWITRVHVPIVTNPQSWFEWEGGGRVHFEVGKAYTFNTLLPHSFGNDGETERVHLSFDVLRQS
jgi:aspartyl/asparaginyl beta-hydroxylase (cupin superfamily)